MGVFMHAAVHCAADPTSMSLVQGSLSSQDVGQGVLVPASHFSLLSRTPSPHFAGQSLSLLAFAPSGQQPSPAVTAVISVITHSASHFVAEPVSFEVAHPMAEGQVLGQSSPSQLSPVSRMPLPHCGVWLPCPELPAPAVSPPTPPLPPEPPMPPSGEPLAPPEPPSWRAPDLPPSALPRPELPPLADAGRPALPA
jgi:hypothetical protein